MIRTEAIGVADSIRDILEFGRVKISNIKPSEWTEKNVMMGKPFPGPFSYKKTPYTREIIDCFAPDHPAKVIAVMKGAQVGFSAGVLYPIVGWGIGENPANILFMVGHADLESRTMDKIDKVINSAGLRHLIRPSILRNKAGKTGDTNNEKQFPGGVLILGNANNHKKIRQLDMQIGLIDDFESIKNSSKESGSTQKLIEQRFAAYYDKMKLGLISTPELKHSSNIEPAYLQGDQRKYMIPCPCCGEFIDLQWSVEMEGETQEKAGITWRVDDKNRVISDSVGYVCQKCSGFFNDQNKIDLLNAGYWQPTAEPSRPGYYSYHINSLYAPPGMYDWERYVNDWVDAHPESGRNEKNYHAFVNLCLGLPYEQQSKTTDANALQRNIRNYPIGLIPESLSIKDGNGKIVLLTCAADLNGKDEDARLDYEIVAWSENQTTYSVVHGSIGTFVRREGKNAEDRERWTYEPHRTRNVWSVLDQILEQTFATDTDRKMKIFITGLDTGHFTNFAYNYIDKTNHNVIGLKGKDVSKFVRLGLDVPKIKKAREREKLFLVEVGQVKDDLSDYMALKWNEREDDEQPAHFMNFPTPSDGFYLYSNFFSHFESEERVIQNKDGQGISAMWKKKSSNSSNHFWDCRVYNIAIKEVLLYGISKELKVRDFSWQDFLYVVKG